MPKPARARKERLDRLLVERGLARSRERAQALVLAGRVRVDGAPAPKAGSLVAGDADIRLIEPDHPFVGRGGVKLAGALAAFGTRVEGRTALDVGASTGGFTDCLLRNGARRVYALDVGEGQLDWSLRSDARVVVMEGINARHLERADLPEPLDLIVVDVSFISLGLILPPLLPHLRPGGEILALVKPQFEVGRLDVGPGGIVRDPELHLSALRSVATAACACGLDVLAARASPLPGATGNREFFLRLAPGRRDPQDPALRRMLEGAVHA